MNVGPLSGWKLGNAVTRETVIVSTTGARRNTPRVSRKSPLTRHRQTWDRDPASYSPYPSDVDQACVCEVRVVDDEVRLGDRVHLGDVDPLGLVVSVEVDPFGRRPSLGL